MGREEKRLRDRAVLRLKKRWGRDPTDAELEKELALLDRAQGPVHGRARSPGPVTRPQRPPNAR